MSRDDADLIAEFRALSRADQRAVESQLTPIERHYVRARLENPRKSVSKSTTLGGGSRQPFPQKYSKAFQQLLNATIDSAINPRQRRMSVTPAMCDTLRRLRDKDSMRRPTRTEMSGGSSRVDDARFADLIARRSAR